MAKKYDPDFWELEALLDSAEYPGLATCIDLVELQVAGFDDRNETRYSEDFATLIQGSFLSSAVALLEHHLKKVCDVMGRKRNLSVTMSDMKGANGFESCLAYLEKVLRVPLEDVDVAIIRAIVGVRNACVHQGGYTKEIPGRLGNLAARISTAEDGRLIILAPFAQDACQACKFFLDKVVNIVESQHLVWRKANKGRGDR